MTPLGPPQTDSPTPKLVPFQEINITYCTCFCFCTLRGLYDILTLK